MLVLCPLEVVKQNRQYEFNVNTISHLKRIWQAKGIRGLYSGYRDLVSRELTCAVMEFSLLEHFLRHSNLIYKPKKLPKLLSYLLTPEQLQRGVLGGIAHGIAGFLTTPFDLIKSRIMVGTMPSLSLPGCVKYVYKEHGILGLYKGWLARTILTTLGGSIYYCGLFKTMYLLGIDKTFMKNRTRDS